MAPGRGKGGARGKANDRLKLGDLVLAKVKGFLAWPAKISNPEDWGHSPDPKKKFVQFFGTSEMFLATHIVIYVNRYLIGIILVVDEDVKGSWWIKTASNAEVRFKNTLGSWRNVQFNDFLQSIFMALDRGLGLFATTWSMTS